MMAARSGPLRACSIATSDWTPAAPTAASAWITGFLSGTSGDAAAASSRFSAAASPPSASAASASIRSFGCVDAASTSRAAATPARASDRSALRRSSGSSDREICCRTPRATGSSSPTSSPGCVDPCLVRVETAERFPGGQRLDAQRERRMVPRHPRQHLSRSLRRHSRSSSGERSPALRDRGGLGDRGGRRGRPIADLRCVIQGRTATSAATSRRAEYFIRYANLSRKRRDRRALITGITGQDGSYLAELLLEKGYEVHGVVRRASTTNYWRIEHLLDRVHLKAADLLDQLSLIRVIEAVRPHEFYNLAAMSFVPASWDQPMLTGEFNSQGVTRALEAVRRSMPRSVSTRHVHEMFGKVREVPQTELTPFYRAVRTASRRCSRTTLPSTTGSYDLFAVSGILFNHESPGWLEFVTRKVTDAAARIKLGSQTRSRSATSTPSATGALPETTCGRCGDAAAGARGRLRHFDRREPLGA